MNRTDQRWLCITKDGDATLVRLSDIQTFCLMPRDGWVLKVVQENGDVDELDWGKNKGIAYEMFDELQEWLAHPETRKEIHCLENGAGE